VCCQGADGCAHRKAEALSLQHAAAGDRQETAAAELARLRSSLQTADREREKLRAELASVKAVQRQSSSPGRGRPAPAKPAAGAVPAVVDVSAPTSGHSERSMAALQDQLKGVAAVCCKRRHKLVLLG
jgi:chromosome segregation ATPase